MRHISLRLKFIAIILAILVVIFGLTAFVLLHSSAQQEVSDLNRETKAFASLATKPIGDSVQLYLSSGAIRIQQEVDRFTALDSNIKNIQVLDATGRAIYKYNNRPVTKFDESASVSFDTFYKSDQRGQIVQVIEPYLSDIGAHPFNILYEISTSELANTSRNAAINIVLFALIGLLASALALYLLIDRFFLRPIERVSDLAGVIAAGNYEQVIELHGDDEIAQLADSVNHMANSLKADIAKLEEVDTLKNEFIMITSHNLRTPLTIIKGNVSLIQGSKISKDLEQMIEAIEQSTVELSNFSEQMLLIADIEAGNRIGSTETVSLGDLVAPLGAEFKKIASAKKLTFELHVTQPEIKIAAHRQHLSIAIRNLLDNALKFTAEGKVEVSAQAHDNSVTISISDTGTGITEPEMKKLFTKFHRGTSTLTYNYKGTGIGLYASKLIVELHGGSVKAESHEGQGSIFTITLPIAHS